ncbi:MAG: hypothetical protein IMF01_05190 [Proteobacteria bacterium]|nr:hypothetical protein [Pseudomonadota bacterium]
MIDRGAAINIPVGSSIIIKPCDVYLEEIDGVPVPTEDRDNNVRTLSPGLHKIKVTYYREIQELFLTDYEGKPISLTVNLENGHIYGLRYNIFKNIKGEKKWTAWIERYK